MTHLAITGRFPLAPPFRETGFFIPASIAPGQQAELLDLAGETLRALGLEVGAAHTEIKLTSEGPRVIEVNGRIGGGVPDMLRLADGPRHRQAVDARGARLADRGRVAAGDQLGSPTGSSTSRRSRRGVSCRSTGWSG